MIHTQQVDQKLVHTIEQIIHEKICNLHENRFKPWCIILNEKSYIALCYVLEKNGEYLYPKTGILDIRHYKDALIVLDMDTSDNVKVLRRPYEELAYPFGE